MPIRNGYARNVFVVTSGEKMAMYAAGNIAIAVDNFKARGYARLRGILLNSRNVEDELAKVEKLADDIESTIISVLPRDGIVQEAENMGKTVVAAFPESAMAAAYRDMAKRVLEVCDDDQ